VTFMQLIEFRTADIDGVRAVDDDWRRATEGKRTARRELLARDHNDPDRYFAVVYFDSYDSAMANSDLPETKAVAQRYAQATDSSPVFYDLDIIGDWT
jgi:hypothetical protein